jgi:cytoskeletal protein RodZ
MWNFIDSLREKSVATRRRYALGISGSFVVVIGLFWAVSFMHSLQQKGQETISTDSSSLDSLTKNISQTYEQTKTNITSANPFVNDSSNQAAVGDSAATTSTSSFDHVIITDPGQ